MGPSAEAARTGGARGHANQRQAPRINLEVDVTFESEHNFYTGFLENLSSGGLFVATHDIRRIGDTVEVRFTLPGRAEPVTATARVRWIREYGNSPDAAPGMGLQFVDLDPAVQKEIERFIALREPIFFED
jgi:uncharacterized protein (TIGR02266 family)